MRFMNYNTTTENSPNVAGGCFVLNKVQILVYLAFFLFLELLPFKSLGFTFSISIYLKNPPVMTKLNFQQPLSHMILLK